MEKMIVLNYFFSLLNNISQHVMHVRLNLLACLLTLNSLPHMRQANVAWRFPLSDSAGISIQGSSLGANFDSSCIVSLSMGVVQSTFAKCTNILMPLRLFSSLFLDVCDLLFA